MWTNPLKIIMAAFIMVLLVQTGDARRSYDFEFIEIENISRYNENRIAYQQIELGHEDFNPSPINNSMASLLIISDSTMYLFRDGYDDPSQVISRRRDLESERKLVPDLWVNKIDGEPDFIQIAERRTELMRQVAGENNSIDEQYINKYQSIRDHFIKKHVEIFRSLLINRKDSNLRVVRKPLSRGFQHTGPTKFFTSVTGKTIDGKLYYAEDANGDGIAETFMVSIPDGFNWGYKSGPNIIYIYQNTQEEIAEIIGQLTQEALYGTEEEHKLIKESFITEDEIKNLIDDIYRIDPDNKRIMDQIPE